MIDVLRIAHLRIAPQEGNSEVGNCEVHHQDNRIEYGDAETFKDSWSRSVGSPLPSIYIKTYIDEKLICLKSDLHPLGLV